MHMHIRKSGNHPPPLQVNNLCLRKIYPLSVLRTENPLQPVCVLPFCLLSHPQDFPAADNHGVSVRILFVCSIYPAVHQHLHFQISHRITPACFLWKFGRQSDGTYQKLPHHSDAAASETKLYNELNET